MTISIKSPTSTTGALQLNASDVLTIESDRSVDIDSGTLHVDATNNRVGIGTTTPSSSLHLYGSSSALRVERTGSDSAALITKTTLGHYGIGTGIGTATNCLNVYDYTAATERMRIESGGKVLIAKTTTDSNERLQISGDTGSLTQIGTYVTSTSAWSHVNFHNGNGIVGRIQTSGTSTSYNTSSDYRLKENNVDITDGISRVKLLKPYRFNFIADADTTVDGFFAHEVQDVVPEAIAGTKDEVDDEGNPVYQGIDQSKLVPLLTSALQEAITKIEALEARIATLEGN